MKEAEDVMDDTLAIIHVGELKDELKDLFEAFDNYDGDDDDDNHQGATGLIIVKPYGQHTLDDFLNDELNEQQEDQNQEASSSGTQHAGEKVYFIFPKVIYLHAEVEGELEENRTRESMLEELGMDDGNLKFDIENEIPPSLEREYSFKFVNEADNFEDVIIEEDSDLSEEDTPFYYTGVDEDFPTLTELFKTHNEDEVRRKLVERISTEGVPETVPQEELLEGRKRWFKHGVQYFEFLYDIKTLPWWDVEELVQTKNIKQFYYGLEVKMHDQKLWNYIKLQAKENFPDWKPHRPEQVIKPPRCLKNMPLRAMEHDFYEDFKGWLYNQSPAEAVISLSDKTTWETRRIKVLDPMWLVNCSKKDIDCLFFNKIVYNEPDKVQAQQYQKIVNVCFAKDINFGRYWEIKFRDLELEDILKAEHRSERFKKIAERAVVLGRRKLERPPDTDQEPIKSQENKIPRWQKSRDGDPEYRKSWNET
ncbi:hypothetical protein Hanom_Chr10g00925571 [Helianthus anomalus]